MNTNRAFLEKCVEEGYLEPDEIENLTEDEINKLASDLMDKADQLYDQRKEEPGN